MKRILSLMVCLPFFALAQDQSPEVSLKSYVASLKHDKWTNEEDAKSRQLLYETMQALEVHKYAISADEFAEILVVIVKMDQHMGDGDPILYIYQLSDMPLFKKALNRAPPAARQYILARFALLHRNYK